MGRCALVVMLAIGCRGRFDDRRDAGSGSDAASDAAPGDAGPSCSAAWELCDGFESATFAPYWTVGTTSRDTTVAHRGTASLHVHTDTLAAGAGVFHEISETATIALGDPTFYVRAYVRFGALPTPPNHFELMMAATQTSSDEDAVFVGTDLSVYTQWIDSAQGNGMTPPINTWLCVLFTVTRATTATGTLVLGGDPAPAIMTNVPTDGSPGLYNMEFGIQFAPANQPVAQPPLDLWFDDLIIDKNPITCAQ